MGASTIKCWQNDTKTLQCIKLQPWSFKRAEFWHKDGHVRNNSGFIYLARRVQKHKRVAQPLMVVLSMIMIDELGDGPSRGS